MVFSRQTNYTPSNLGPNWEPFPSQTNNILDSTHPKRSINAPGTVTDVTHSGCCAAAAEDQRAADIQRRNGLPGLCITAPRLCEATIVPVIAAVCHRTNHEHTSKHALHLTS